MSIFLNYIERNDIQDFEEIISKKENFLMLENTWKTDKRWYLPEFVE